MLHHYLLATTLPHFVEWLDDCLHHLGATSAGAAPGPAARLRLHLTGPGGAPTITLDALETAPAAVRLLVDPPDAAGEVFWRAIYGALARDYPEAAPPPRRGGPHADGELARRNAQMRAARVSGVSVAEIARRWNLSESYVRALLRGFRPLPDG